jgi:hypothetical protein
VIRLNAYNTQTAPLLPYYQGQGKLVEVDGSGHGSTKSPPVSTTHWPLYAKRG